MGLFRILLSVSVLISHTTPIFGVHLLPGPTAVWAFFVISGFYMQMIFGEKYVNALLFFQNRFLRLYPVFFLATLLLLCVSGLPQTSDISLISHILAVTPNITMIGADLLFLFHYGPISGWHFTFGYPGPWDNIDGEHVRRIGHWLLLKPAWSIGIEIWFYLLVPVLSKLPHFGLVAVAVASFLLRTYMEYRNPGITYFFFPANIGYFCLGMLSYRFYHGFVADFCKWSISLAVSLSALFMLFAREWFQGIGDDSIIVCLAVTIVIPFIFHAFKDISLDKHLGNLSYPLYLFHAPVIYLLTLWSPPTGIGVLAITLAISGLSIVLIESPVDRWRQSRVREMNQALDGRRGLCRTT